MRQINKEKLIRLFNSNQKEFMAELDVIGSDNKPRYIALFMVNNIKHLDPALIGELFAKDAELNQQILEEFLSIFNFEDKQIDDALRLFMASFKISGEGQMIDRIMTAFARQYCKDNNVEYFDEEVIHGLSFALMLINTDLHNPNIQKHDRISKKKFVEMCHDLADDLDKKRDKPLGLGHDDEILEKMYDNIANEEFKIQFGDINKVSSGIKLSSKGFSVDKSPGAESATRTDLLDLLLHETTGSSKQSDKTQKTAVNGVTYDTIRIKHNNFFAALFGARETVLLRKDGKDVMEITLCKPSMLQHILGKKETISIRPVGTNPANVMIVQEFADALNTGSTKLTASDDFQEKLVSYEEATKPTSGPGT